VVDEAEGAGMSQRIKRRHCIAHHRGKTPCQGCHLAVPCELRAKHDDEEAAKEEAKK
jgi:hypothetical protein